MSEQTVKYVGTRRTMEVHRVEGTERKRLNPRLDIMSHSATGLNWGYGGSGPAQLALALCADALGDDDRAVQVYQDFKWKIVKGLGAAWVLTKSEVLEVIAQIEKGRAVG